MSYVIRRTDQSGGFVTWPGRMASYTHKLQEARTFATREEAQREKCGNEAIMTVEDAMRRGGLA